METLIYSYYWPAADNFTEEAVNQDSYPHYVSVDGACIRLSDWELLHTEPLLIFFLCVFKANLQKSNKHINHKPFDYAYSWFTTNSLKHNYDNTHQESK